MPPRPNSPRTSYPGGVGQVLGAGSAGGPVTARESQHSGPTAASPDGRPASAPAGPGGAPASTGGPDGAGRVDRWSADVSGMTDPAGSEGFRARGPGRDYRMPGASIKWPGGTGALCLRD